MKNEQTIKTLEKLKDYLLTGGYLTESEVDQKKYLEELEMAIDELKKQQWIRTCDSLPPHLEIVCVSYLKYTCGALIKGVTMGMRVDNDWEILEPRSWDETQNIEIVAWKTRSMVFGEE